MEQGDLKVRVRVLESERAFQKLEVNQNNMALLVAASGFLNVGILLSRSATSSLPISILTKASFIVAGLCGIQLPIGLIKLKALEKKISGFS